jgi:hypothetical protein
VKAVEDYFPDCPKKEYGDFLMAATAFPFGKPSIFRMQLKEAKDAGCKTYKDAMAYGNAQMDKEMEAFKKADKKRSKKAIEP